ncbi:hypothetical protein WR25_06252 isoform C [Diploscapter pachys]|uniref:Pre-SET domain-containing protein n=1 Tax=Diploscapter pachys TaxID=2018661 RepID=A0A2A2LXS9_9BILA|nr:hypothetical protein WR25_06252 isoform A [Diploscapter pachys]PAV90808.1 hypothetical protein WR25_06252 isoform B [Diploscapter pachys]PAV90809.1 hypothetical protein WR25_06252 isoform C [Diploscapter pachys]
MRMSSASFFVSGCGTYPSNISSIISLSRTGGAFSKAASTTTLQEYLLSARLPMSLFRLSTNSCISLSHASFAAWEFNFIDSSTSFFLTSGRRRPGKMDLDLEHSGLDENRRPQLQTGSGEVALKRGRDNQLAESNEGDCPSKRRRCSFDELYNGALQEQGRRNENRGKENGNASLPAHVSTSSTVRRSSSRDESQQQQQQRRDVNVALFTSRTRSNSKSEMSQGVRVKSAARTIPEEEENDAGVDSDALSRSERPSSSQTHVESICNDAEEELCISRSSEQPGPRMGDVSVPPTPITSRSSSEPFTSTVSSTSSSTSSSVHAEDKKEDKLVRNNFECKVEEDTPYVLLGSRENSKAQYKEGEFEIDMIADHDERTGDYLVAWKGWTMSTMSYVSLADLNSPELLKIYKEYVRAASAIERRPVVERVGHHERILWRNIGFYSGRHALFKNKLREARFNLLLQEMNIAPVFVENWLATLRKKSNFGELPPFRLTYKSFMSGHLRRKFLALPHDFNECRCRCENGAEDCSTSNLDCCTNGVSTDSDNVRLFYDLSKRLALPNRIQAVTYELVECSDSCKCGPACPNRVTQRGRQVPVVIFFEDADKNWGLRAGEPIRRGQYIAEYVGEVRNCFFEIIF